MLREGKGVIAPHPAVVKVTPHDISILSAFAASRDAHRHYRNSFSQWKRGMIKNPILVGMVGEHAFQQYMLRRGIKVSGVSTDLNNGDGGIDVKIGSLTYQIKTSQKRYPTLLVRRVHGGRVQPLVADRFIFCKWNDSDSDCIIRGWCTSETIADHGTVAPGKRGGAWHNNELHECWLSPLDDLVIAIKEELHGR